MDLARRNGEHLERNYKSACDAAGEAQDSLQAFADAVKATAQVSKNTSGLKLLEILDAGCLLNPYDRARRSGGDPTAFLEKDQGDYFRRRTGFEGSFDRGREFHYGAVNLGGAGLNSFGEFCIILRQDFLESLEVHAYVWDNSLEHFVSAEGELDRGRFDLSLATLSNRHQLAAIKHANDLKPGDQESWPVLICCSACFIEVIVAGHISTAAFAVIRIGHKDYMNVFRASRGGVLAHQSAAEKAATNDAVMAMKRIRALGIRLEMVPE